MDSSTAQALAGKYLDRTFSLDGSEGTTHFTIHKLLAMEGFRVLDKIREAVGERLSHVDSDASVPTMIAAVALSIPTAKVEEIMRPLFAQVTYTNTHAKTPLKVSDGNIIDDAAFAGLEPIAIYNLLIRCLAVNFFSSFTEIKSLLATALPDSSPQPTATSTPSSLHPSTQA